MIADSLPLARAVRDGHPAQGRFRVRLGEHGLREVEVSALPLVEGNAYDGSLIVFWPVEAAVDV